MKTIGFNADEKMKRLTELLADRLGYPNPSEMLRSLVQEEIDAEIPKAEQEDYLKHFDKNKSGQVRPFARTRRRGKQVVNQ